ncbi:MAG: TetR/AcrR family transcriptional regulator [Bacillaceae bacterium]|nr:TetR/AcrR family transcriptional regulator [Bacillaceae bacterium]
MRQDHQHLSPRQKQAIQTRQELLDAGLEVFLENGFQKTTISQIIKKANKGYGTAYVYFQNKDELFIELMEHVMNRFYEVAELTFEPESKQEAYEQIERQVRLFLTLAVQERKMLNVMREAMGISEAVNEKWIEIRKRFIKRITEDIQYSQRAGLAKSNLDAAYIARAWFYANEMFMWDMVANENVSLDDAARNLTMMYTGGLYE